MSITETERFFAASDTHFLKWRPDARLVNQVLTDMSEQEFKALKTTFETNHSQSLEGFLRESLSGDTGDQALTTALMKSDPSFKDPMTAAQLVALFEKRYLNARGRLKENGIAPLYDLLFGSGKTLDGLYAALQKVTTELFSRPDDEALQDQLVELLEQTEMLIAIHRGQTRAVADKVGDFAAMAVTFLVARNPQLSRKIRAAVAISQAGMIKAGVGYALTGSDQYLWKDAISGAVAGCVGTSETFWLNMNRKLKTTRIRLAEMAGTTQPDAILSRQGATYRIKELMFAPKSKMAAGAFIGTTQHVTEQVLDETDADDIGKQLLTDALYGALFGAISGRVPAGKSAGFSLPEGQQYPSSSQWKTALEAIENPTTRKVKFRNHDGKPVDVELVIYGGGKVDQEEIEAIFGGIADYQSADEITQPQKIYIVPGVDLAQLRKGKIVGGAAGAVEEFESGSPGIVVVQSSRLDKSAKKKPVFHTVVHELAHDVDRRKQFTEVQKHFGQDMAVFRLYGLKTTTTIDGAQVAYEDFATAYEFCSVHYDDFKAAVGGRIPRDRVTFRMKFKEWLNGDTDPLGLRSPQDAAQGVTLGEWKTEWEKVVQPHLKGVGNIEYLDVLANKAEIIFNKVFRDVRPGQD